MMGGLNQPWHQHFLAFNLQFQDGRYEPDTNTNTNTSLNTSIQFQDGKYPFPTQTFMASDVDHPI